MDVRKKRTKLEYKYIEPLEEYYNNSPYRLVIKPSQIPGAGKGVFADEPIQKNICIGEYLGERMFVIECGAYLVQFQYQRGGIDASCYPRCYMAMINDSFRSQFKNNCRLVETTIDNEPRIEIWSIQNIEPGEELFMSYGDEYWTNY